MMGIGNRLRGLRGRPSRDALFIVAGGLALLIALVRLGTALPVAADFDDCMYPIARGMLEGASPYAATLGALEQWWFSPGSVQVCPVSYPPLALSLMLPYALFEPEVARWLWWATNVTLIVVTSLGLATAFKDRASRYRLAPIFAMSFLVFGSTQGVLELGQLEIVVASLMAATWLAMGCARDGGQRRLLLAGFFLGAAAMIKPFVAPIIVIVALRGQIRMVAGFALALATVFGGAVILWGPGVITDYAAVLLMQRNPDLTAWESNIGSSGFLLRALVDTVWSRPWVALPSPVVGAAIGVWSIALLIVTGRILRKRSVPVRLEPLLLSAASVAAFSYMTPLYTIVIFVAAPFAAAWLFECLRAAPGSGRRPMLILGALISAPVIATVGVPVTADRLTGLMAPLVAGVVGISIAIIGRRALGAGPARLAGVIASLYLLIASPAWFNLWFFDRTRRPLEGLDLLGHSGMYFAVLGLFAAIALYGAIGMRNQRASALARAQERDEATREGPPDEGRRYPVGDGPTLVGTPGSGPRTLVIVPTYNEAANLGRLVARIRQTCPFDLCVVDDGSPDGTGQLADRLAADPANRMVVLHRAGRSGRGGAVLAGLRYGLANDHEGCVEMDADLSHLPEQLPELVAGLAEADAVIGSRYEEGSRITGWPLRRRLFSRFANRFARSLLRVPGVSDYSNGFRAYGRPACSVIVESELRETGYAALAEWIVAIHRAGLSVRSIPIRFTDRTEGRSKTDMSEIVATFRAVIRLCLALRRGAARREMRP